MNILMFIVGIGLMLLGAVIWRFKLINILSNVDMNEVDVKRKNDLARYAGCFVMAVSSLFALLAYLMGRMTTEWELLILLVCLIPIIMFSAIIYLAGLGRYMKK